MGLSGDDCGRPQAPLRPELADSWLDGATWWTHWRLQKPGQRLTPGPERVFPFAQQGSMEEIRTLPSNPALVRHG